MQPFNLRVNVLARDVPAVAAFSPEDLENFLAQNTDVNSPGKLLERLPREYKEHWIMITRRESAQRSEPTAPRMILPSQDSSKLFAFCAGSGPPPCKDIEDVIEYIQFSHAAESATFKDKFRFAEIRFPTGQRAEVKIDGRDPLPCRVCHGRTNLRPNWDAYDSWANALPFNRDRLYKNSEEDKSFRRLFEHLRDDPILKQLKLPDGITRAANGLIAIDYDGQGTDDLGGQATVFFAVDGQGLPEYRCQPSGPGCRSTTVREGGRGRYLTLFHSGRAKTDTLFQGRAVALFDQLSALNAKRVAQDLIEWNSGANIRPVALAIASRFVTKDNIGEFAGTALPQFLACHGVASFDAMVEDTHRRRRELPQLKANRQAENMKGLIEAEDLVPIQPTPENITKELARRTVDIGKVDELTGFIADQEDYSEDETIALFRFFLEPWGINVRGWSMAAFVGEASHTFADVFSANAKPPYRSEIRDRLTAALAGTDISRAGLAAASKQIFEAATFPSPARCPR